MPVGARGKSFFSGLEAGQNKKISAGWWGDGGKSRMT